MEKVQETMKDKIFDKSVPEIRELKSKAEGDIFAIIKKLEQDTGLKFQEIQPCYYNQFSLYSFYVKLKIEGI